LAKNSMTYFMDGPLGAYAVLFDLSKHCIYYDY